MRGSPARPSPRASIEQAGTTLNHGSALLLWRAATMARGYKRHTHVRSLSCCAGRRLGFSVTLWVTPFAEPASAAYAEGREKGYWLQKSDGSGQPAKVPSRAPEPCPFAAPLKDPHSRLCGGRCAGGKGMASRSI